MSAAEITVDGYRGTLAGRGGFASVYRVLDRLQRAYALKLVDSDADRAIGESLYHEFVVGSELVHPQIVRVHHFGQFEQRPYIVFDWVDGTSLFHPFQNPTESDFVTLVREMARVLYFMHQRGWVHGDMKPENFMWKRPDSDCEQSAEHSLCVLDLGLARPIGDDSRPRGAGTVGYCAPEFLTGQPADGRADWYSIGIVLYEWIFGERPYAADEPAIEIAGHLEGTPDFSRERVRATPSWADDFIRQLLSKSADSRGEDEAAILTVLAEHIPECEPLLMLNESLKWHAASEACRLRRCEAELLAQVSEQMDSGMPACWAIHAHGRASDTFGIRLQAMCARAGYGVSIESSDDGETHIFEHASSHAPARIAIDLLHRIESAEHPEAGGKSQSRVTFLPWDRDECLEYLSGVLCDHEVAAIWVDGVHKATCGLPSATQQLLKHLIDSGRLAVDKEGWSLDEDSVAAWSAQHADKLISDCTGTPTPEERHACEWLALAEGFGSEELLLSLWELPQADSPQVLKRLLARGVVAAVDRSTGGPFTLRLRLHGHDAILRSAMSADSLEKRSLKLSQLLEKDTTDQNLRILVLSHVYQRAGLWELAAESCLVTATTAITNDDRDSAMHFIQMAQTSAQKISDERRRHHWLGHARMVEGDLQKAAGQLDVARQIYRELLALCRRSGDRRLLAETLHDLADLYHITQRYSKGICAERQAMRIWQELGDRAQLSRSLNSLGNLHRIAADYPRALEFYAKAIEIQQELGLEKLAAINLNNIGIIHWLQHDFAAADRCFQEALAIHERLGAAVEVARVLNNLGAIGFVQGNLPESQDYFLRAAEINADSGARSEELFNRWNLVEVALETGDLRSAVSLGEKVFQACMDIGEHATAAEVAALLSDCYIHVGDDRRSRSFYRESRELSLALKNDDLQLHLELNQATRHILHGQFDEARALLDAVAPVGKALTNRYRFLDALILRAQLAVAGGDTSSLSDIWRIGSAEAEAISAPHKRAQLAAVCAASHLSGPLSEELEAVAARFLDERPRWLWASRFRLHAARVQFNSRQFDPALATIETVVTQLRQDGHGDLLWRALVLQGEVLHAMADYEPAIRALEEAGRVLKFVASTVDDEMERTAYLACDDVRILRRIQERITQLVS